MANLYTPEQLGIKLPANVKNGEWIKGRNYFNGTLTDPGVIHPEMGGVGAGQAVSQEVNAQSAATQGVSPQQLETYLQQQRQNSAQVQPTATYTPGPTGTGATGTTGSGLGLTTPTTINLPEMYNNLTKESGIGQIQAELSDKEKAYIDAQKAINDNPFLSEATRVGRLDKLSKDYESRVANLRNEIATKQADIETQLNLQTKQFDINSTAATQALNQLNTLLSLGALDNASGTDIANLTRSTGISSDMIQSAIAASKKKNQQTEVIKSENDAGVVTITVIDPSTGEIINQKSLGAIGNAQGTGGGSATGTKQVETKFINDVNSNIQEADLFPRLVQAYAPLLSLQDIYRLYSSSKASEYYGSPTEPPDAIKSIYDASRGG